MKFAFMIHPISKESAALMDLDFDGSMQTFWGVDPLSVCAHLHGAVKEARRREGNNSVPVPHVVDEFKGLTSQLGQTAEGRLPRSDSPVRATGSTCSRRCSSRR